MDGQGALAAEWDDLQQGRVGGEHLLQDQVTSLQQGVCSPASELGHRQQGGDLLQQILL